MAAKNDGYRWPNYSFPFSFFSQRPPFFFGGNHSQQEAIQVKEERGKARRQWFPLGGKRTSIIEFPSALLFFPFFSPFPLFVLCLAPREISSIVKGILLCRREGGGFYFLVRARGGDNFFPLSLARMGRAVFNTACRRPAEAHDLARKKIFRKKPPIFEWNTFKYFLLSLRPNLLIED